MAEDEAATPVPRAARRGWSSPSELYALWDKDQPGLTIQLRDALDVTSLKEIELIHDSGPAAKEIDKIIFKLKDKTPQKLKYPGLYAYRLKDDQRVAVLRAWGMTMVFARRGSLIETQLREARTKHMVEAVLRGESVDSVLASVPPLR